MPQRSSTGRPGVYLVLAANLALAGCGGEPAGDEGAAPARVLGPERGVTDDERDAATSARVEAFLAAPKWPELVDFVAQPHAVARERLGPHHLHYRAEFSTSPKGVEPGDDLPPVAVDEPIYERFSIVDELELRWAAAPGEPPRFHLAQFSHDQLSDDENRRELIIIDEQRWAARDRWPWTTGPVESDLWQLWLDDAQHTPLDLVELAGPSADIDEVSPVEHRGREALRVRLRASTQRHPERVVDGLEPWRQQARVEVAAAEIVLDRATGLWLTATFELRWTYEDRAHRPVEGRARLDGAVEVLGTPPAITPPEGAQPVPERDRPELLRQRLLGGLAGP